MLSALPQAHADVLEPSGQLGDVVSPLDSGDGVYTQTFKTDVDKYCVAEHNVKLKSSKKGKKIYTVSSTFKVMDKSGNVTETVDMGGGDIYANTHDQAIREAFSMQKMKEKCKEKTGAKAVNATPIKKA
ncbi:MAG: hypothetical protein AB7F82_08445 [Alphaproteobacteria bacterium]